MNGSSSWKASIDVVMSSLTLTIIWWPWQSLTQTSLSFSESSKRNLSTKSVDILLFWWLSWVSSKWFLDLLTSTFHLSRILQRLCTQVKMKIRFQFICFSLSALNLIGGLTRNRLHLNAKLNALFALDLFQTFILVFLFPESTYRLQSWLWLRTEQLHMMMEPRHMNSTLIGTRRRRDSCWVHFSTVTSLPR
jgi:hypothetical protein